MIYLSNYRNNGGILFFSNKYMAEDKPVEAKEMHKETTTTTTTSSNMPAEPKSGNNMVKIIIIIVVILCLCSLCSVGAYLAATRFLVNNAGNITNDIINQGLRDAANQQSGNSTTGNSTTNGLSGSDASGSFSFGGELPTGFPTDVPIYPNSKVGFTSSSKSSNNGKDEYTATFTVGAKVADVVNFYKTKLPANGWTITAEQNFFGSSITADKDTRQATVVVLGDDSSSSDLTYTLSVTQK